MQEGLLLSTDLVDERFRNDVWREITRPFFDTILHGDRETTLQGSLRSRSIGDLLVGPTSFNGQQYDRNRKLILQSGLDHYLLQVFKTGSLVADCEDRPMSAVAGDICIFDLARTFTSRVERGSTISLVLPRAQIDKAMGGRTLHGTVLKRGSPITGFLTELIVSLSKLAAALCREDVQAIENEAIALLASSIAHRTHHMAACSNNLAPMLRQRLLRFIDTNINNPDLGPALLIEHFRVSRAHLYRMFVAEGGVSRIVREKRLDASYRELTANSLQMRSITQIAYELGFSSSSQFLRAFRARFGMTPSEARHEALARALASPRLSDLQGTFSKYARQLGLAGVS